MRPELNPESLLFAYANGIFPMADQNGVLQWLAPNPRAIIDLHGFKVSRSLRTVIRRGVYEVRINHAFREVIVGCADRPDGTWISQEIREAYGQLHDLGFAHSVESWREGRLAGGLYGVALGGAFFGESMFHRQADASKVAMVALVDRLKTRGFVLLDIQFLTEHLIQFGACEVTRPEYEQRLQAAIELPRAFENLSTSVTGGKLETAASGVSGG